MIVIYDGQCLFCEAWVKFVIDKSSEGSVLFYPMQWANLSTQEMLLSSDVPSMIVISRAGVMFDSSASLLVMSKMIFPYGFMAKVLSFMPKKLRDFGYKIVGKNRHWIFGKKEVCELPTSHGESNFIINAEAFADALKAYSLTKNTLDDLVRHHYK